MLNLKTILIGPFLGLIWLYQKLVSPLLPASCIYEPSCSCYAIGAFKRHGVIKGCVLSIWRILRCQPFCKGGHDPVPEDFTIWGNKLNG